MTRHAPPVRGRRRPPIDLLLGLLAGLLVALAGGTGLAQNPPPNPPGAGPAPRSDLLESLQRAVTAETAATRALTARLAEDTRRQAAWETERETLQLGIGAREVLLMAAGTPPEELAAARTANETDLNTAGEALKAAQRQRADAAAALAQVDEQIELNTQQRSRLNTDSPAAVIAGLDALAEQFTAKRDLLARLEALHGRRMADLNALVRELDALQGRLDAHLAQRRREALFTREATVARLHRLTADLRDLAQRMPDLSRWDTWRGWARHAATGLRTVLAAVLLALTALLLLRRMRRRLLAAASQVSGPWSRTGLTLLARSMPLMGMTLLAVGVGRIPAWSPFPVPLQALSTVLLALLFTRWGRDLLDLVAAEPPAVPPTVTVAVKRVLVWCRWLVIVHVGVGLATGPQSLLGSLVRLAAGTVLLVWLLRFWRRNRSRLPAALGSGRRALLGTAGYGMTGGGLVLELAGFGPLAVLWYAGWAGMLATGLWAVLLRASLREGEAALRRRIAPEHPWGPLIWLGLRFTRILWAAGAALAVGAAWGGTWQTLGRVVGRLAHPLALGGLQLNLLGGLYAALFLMIVNTAAQLWREQLAARLLAGSRMEPGWRNSLTVIVFYLIWSIGILGALSMVGISMTTLTVGFGALGIGLGFGLQNIFNNFISGLILLFERPIQVGDAVEVNGIWGEVKKINVRATQVQTYDNASLIIPNSEFISSQVTNWTFKDQRIRRNIDVGVAYGSDVALVRETLLEVAAGTPDILNLPAPDVHFTDFGDSALLFRLRYWTTLDHYFSTSTAVRFEIHRLFHARGIEIAFPQRDIHIRSQVAVAPGRTAPSDEPR